MDAVGSVQVLFRMDAAHLPEESVFSAPRLRPAPLPEAETSLFDWHADHLDAPEIARSNAMLLG